MEKEIVLRSNYINEKVATIYFGGGTPSLLKKENLERLFRSIHIHYPIADNAEITLEVNPDDISEEILYSWRGLGVNRLSIGIQTFDEDSLNYLNRIHTSKDAIASVEMARRCGFDNFNIDLIYSLPSKNQEILQRDLSIIKDMQPAHLSAYNLTIEPKTVFGKWLQKGKIIEMNEDFATEQYWLLCETLKLAGYIHYEVSNFSLPGYESKHNSSYWKGSHYLGIGPGAHSFNGKSRQYNKPNNAIYIKSLENGIVPFTIETLDNENIVNEYLLTGLRTIWGIDLNYLKNEHNYSFTPKQQKLVDNLLKNDLAFINGGILILTEKGFLLADQIALELSI